MKPNRRVVVGILLGLVAATIAVVLLGMFYPGIIFVGWDTPGVNDRSKYVACPMDAKLCPDGSYVARVGSRCEFAPCPKEKTLGITPEENGASDNGPSSDAEIGIGDDAPEAIAQQDLKTYRDSRNGIEFGYPSEFSISNEPQRSFEVPERGVVSNRVLRSERKEESDSTGITRESIGVIVWNHRWSDPENIPIPHDFILFTEADRKHREGLSEGYFTTGSPNSFMGFPCLLQQIYFPHVSRTILISVTVCGEESRDGGISGSPNDADSRARQLSETIISSFRFF